MFKKILIISVLTLSLAASAGFFSTIARSLSDHCESKKFSNIADGIECPHFTTNQHVVNAVKPCKLEGGPLSALACVNLAVSRAFKGVKW